MAKRKKTKNSVSKVEKHTERSKIDKQVSEEDNIKNVVKLIIVILVILLVFYLLTLLILNRKTTKVVNNASIQYTKILAGESFTQKEDEYLVFFYDMKDSKSTEYADLVSKYRDKDKHLTIYTVDLGEGLNKRYITEDDENSSALKASELRIKGATLIHFKEKKIDEYITSSFGDYLDVNIEK